ncbi:MAG TPA: histidine triad nucleotide-binding protein [Anaeromyxobacter sp.]|nr:histidine triad nucleotide-binding protein [Anaeromyxobacter sp.]
MSDCLFCKLVAGQIPARIVHQDDDTVAFEDINPQAPTHLLVIPKKHIPTLNDLSPADDAIAGKLLRVAAELAAERGIAVEGWRAVMNTNRGAGQTVFHIHLHVLGGRAMTWPPG